jgi:hypothetical protein
MNKEKSKEVSTNRAIHSIVKCMENVDPLEFTNAHTREEEENCIRRAIKDYRIFL